MKNKLKFIPKIPRKGDANNRTYKDFMIVVGTDNDDNKFSTYRAYNWKDDCVDNFNNFNIYYENILVNDLSYSELKLLVNRSLKLKKLKQIINE